MSEIHLPPFCLFTIKFSFQLCLTWWLTETINEMGREKEGGTKGGGRKTLCYRRMLVNKYFRQSSLMDAKTIGWKVVGEQKYHMVSRYHPTGYRRKEMHNGSHHPNQMVQPGIARAAQPDCTWSSGRHKASPTWCSPMFSLGVIMKKLLDKFRSLLDNWPGLFHVMKSRSWWDCCRLLETKET